MFFLAFTCVLVAIRLRHARRKSFSQRNVPLLVDYFARFRELENRVVFFTVVSFVAVSAFGAIYLTSILKFWFNSFDRAVIPHAALDVLCWVLSAIFLWTLRPMKSV
jgi:hypothetical protein